MTVFSCILPGLVPVRLGSPFLASGYRILETQTTVSNVFAVRLPKKADSDGTW